MTDARLMYFEGIPSQEIEKACSDLESVGLKCESRRMEAPKPWNSLEWFIPTAIVLFIAKPYLKSFLGEMGKDHYGFLKKGIGRLWARFFGKDTTVPKITVMTVSGIRKSEYTHTFSVVASANDGRTIKLMLPEDIGEDEFALHIDVFLDFLCKHYDGDNDAAIPSELNVKGIGKHVFVSLSMDKRKIRFLDPLPNHVRNQLTHNKANARAKINPNRWDKTQGL